MFKYLILFLLVFAIRPAGIVAQNFTMDGTPVSSCSGSFFDPGGPNGNYGNNLNLSTTICSDGSAGTHVRLDFSGVSLAPGDIMCFYDGPSATAPLLSCSDQYTQGVPFVVQATAVNPGGCLTVVFTTNGSGVDAGWSSSISCVPSCQQILADLVSTFPVANPADTGWIDICPGKRVTFTGTGIYPQNGFSYQQSDFTTEFEWNFGDGGIAYGPLVSHVFNEPGGYFVQLFLKDTMGCRSTNLVNQRIRVSPKPDFSSVNGTTTTICSGDTIALSAATSSNFNGQNLMVTPGSGSFSIDGSRSDSLALPDGTGVPYQTSLYFTEFSPGQVLTNVNDLEAVSVNMEHSWARDIEIKLTCPNGQSIVLHNHPGNVGSQVFLGIPNDNDNFSPIPGTGWDYQWTPNAVNGTWLEYANTVLPGGMGTLPSGDYSSFDAMTDLVGCPLNGEWKLTITDFWPIDNGFIFNWGINFNDLLYPEVETFDQNLVSWMWQPHPSIFYNANDSIIAAPENAGTAAYKFQVTDGFGCVWDTSVQVTVLPFTHPNCFSCNTNNTALQDTVVCVGESVQLNGATLGNYPDEVRFESYPDYRFGNANHPHPNPFQSPVNVNSLGYSILSNPIAQINSVCVDLETDFDADITIFLRSPDNKLLELSSGNGGSGDNYKITCFSPNASALINTGTAPFNGSYLPEGNWNALSNAQVNGDWKLLVSDGFGVNQYGKLKWWSIGFNISNTVNYTWNNTTGLSCTNCPDPVATVSQPTTYILTATDNFNCAHKDTVTVDAQMFFPAPTGLVMVSMENGNMIWTWDLIPNVTDYEVQINNGGWTPVSGNTYTVTGLNPGDNIIIEVRALSTSVACPPNIVSSTQTYIACTLATTLNGTLPVSCPESSDGSCDVVATGGQGQTLFYASFGPNTPFINGNLTLFPAGDHFVYAVDSAGCRDTSFFTILSPAPMVPATTAVDVICNGSNSGSVSAMVTGGNGSLTYEWRPCGGGPSSLGATITSLPGGCYGLTVTDQSGCSVTATQNIAENPPVIWTIEATPPNCAGSNDGSIIISDVQGGVGPYTFLWSDSNTASSRTDLTAGTYTCTISDAVGCTDTIMRIFPMLQPLVIDSIQATPATCNMAMNGLAQVFAHGGTGGLSYFWSFGSQNTQTAINLGTGNYTVTVTDVNGCTSTLSTFIAEPSAIVPVVVSTTGEQCTGSCDGSATINVSGGTAPYTLNWNVPAIPPNSLSYNALCPGSYTVSILDAHNCPASLPFSIGAAVPIDISFSTANPTCASISDGAAMPTINGGQLPFSYLWSDGQTTASAIGLTCSTYTLTVTDAANCSAKATLTLTCPDQLLIDNISTTDVKCNSGTDGTATVSFSGGTGPFSYSWSGGNPDDAATAEALPAGIYTVTVTDANGCFTTSTATVTEPSAITANTGSTPALCLNSSDGTAWAEPAGGTGGYTFLWNTGATTENISGLPAGFYSVTITDQQNCTLEAGPIEVSQPSTNVTVDVQQTKTACFQSADGEATALASGGNGAPYQYSWSNNTFNSVAGQLTVGTYTVTASDGNGCSASASITITQFDSITVNIATLPPTCFGYTNGQAAVNLVKGGAGMGVFSNYTLQWSGLPGAPAGDYWGQIPADTTVQLTVTDQMGCSRVFPIKLNSPAEIIPTIESKNITCNDAHDGSAVVTSNQGDNPILVYTWSTGTTGTSVGGLAPGTFTVTLTDSKGCSGTGAATIIEPDPLSVMFQTTDLTCTDDTTGAISTIAAGGTPPYNYVWNNGQQTVMASGLTAGTYTVTLTDANQCVLADSAAVVNPEPTILLLASEDVLCYGLPTGRIEINVINGTPPFLYGIENEPFGGSTVFLALRPGSYTVSVKDANGCITSGQTTIGQPDPLEVSVTPLESSVVYGDSVILTASAVNGTGNIVYRWRSEIIENYTCADSVSCASIGFVPEIENQFFVIATDANGCSGEASANVLVEKPRDIYVPTGFTPNGDGNNDLLHIFGKSRQVDKIKTFRIFDRWGEMVYEDLDIPINDTTRGWDGTFRGADCLPDVYVWIMEVVYRDGYTDALHGETTLIR